MDDKILYWPHLICTTSWSQRGKEEISFELPDVLWNEILVR